MMVMNSLSSLGSEDKVDDDSDDFDLDANQAGYAGEKIRFQDASNSHDHSTDELAAQLAANNHNPQESCPCISDAMASNFMDSDQYE